MPVRALDGGLGYAMVGGLALSQLLTLYTTPIVYLYLDHLRRRLDGRQREPLHDNEKIKRLLPGKFCTTAIDGKS